jgi:arylsulfatase A-like enzyme
MKRSILALATALCALASAAVAADKPHNVVLFVADGLRSGMVNEENTPAIAALQREGVRFANTHSMFPTVTTANASAISTGHKLGDTGDFSNSIYTGRPTPGAFDSITPFLESDLVLGDVDANFGGDYLGQDTVMKAARLKGYSTAVVGKVGPAFIFDHTERSGEQTITIDDATGWPAGFDQLGRPMGTPGIPLSKEVAARLASVGLPAQTPSRGKNGRSGSVNQPGASVANVVQQDYFVGAATKVVLPLFKERDKPFFLVFWSRDPDGTQHNQTDGWGQLEPGINGPTSLAAIRNADHDLAELLAALKALGLDQTTDVIVTADHGFSTISKESKTSYAATLGFADTLADHLPLGFLAIDLAHALSLPIIDPDAQDPQLQEIDLTKPNVRPSRGNALIGGDKDHPKIVVASNGGSDLIYLPDADKDLARKIVDVLSAEDYVSGVFVADSLGPIPGTLPLSAVDLEGSAVTPHPAIVVNFRSYATECADKTTCGVDVADTNLQQGQGMHGSFSRADTSIAGGAAGPDFKSAFVDQAPTSNADIGRTIARLLGLEIEDKGKLSGRVLTEAMPNGALPEWTTSLQKSDPDAAGRVTVAATQSVGAVRYFDAAGYPGRTLGLTAGQP